MENQILYFCDECKHVYFKIPNDNICFICHNQLSESDVVQPMDILTCETCHRIYIPQNSQEIIPQNENHLCGCIHQCPTNSTLQIGQDFKYIGNITLADIFQCGNCKAIYFLNYEHDLRECTECNAKIISPLHIDPENQKSFFRCANPNHGIRLKIRDLILKNNQIIDSKMVQVKNNEGRLFTEYENRKEKINQEKSLFAKNQKKLKLLNLDVWAQKQRRLLYSALQPSSLRCSTFKMSKAEDDKVIFEETHDGCGAMAHVRIRKIMISDNQGTIIDRKSPVEPIKSEIEEQIQAPKIETIQKSLLEEKMLLKTQILRPIPEDQIEFSISSLPPLQDIVSKIPNLQEDQKIILLELKGKKITEESYTTLNWAYIPVQFLSDSIEIGKEEIINAYWYDPEFFSIQPYCFDNITPHTPNSFQFALQRKNNQYFLKKGMDTIVKSETIPKNQEQDTLLEQDLLNLDEIKKITINTFYSFEKEQYGMYHNLQYNISIIG